MQKILIHKQKTILTIIKLYFTYFRNSDEAGISFGAFYQI